MKGAHIQKLIYHPQEPVHDDYVVLQKYLQKHQSKHLSIDNIFSGLNMPLISDVGITAMFFTAYIAVHIFLHGVKSLFKLRAYE